MSCPKRPLAFFAPLFLLLVLAGCEEEMDFGEGDGNDPSAGETVTESGPVALEGRAVNGVMEGAEVRLYDYRDGDWVSAGVTGETDEQGRFRLDDIPSTLGPGPVKLVAEAGAGARVTCTAYPDCGENDFGEPFAREFTLEAIVPLDMLEAGEPVSVTPLSHLAALWSAQLPRMSNGVARAGLEQIARWFDLEAGKGFVHGEPVDVTSETELPDASMDMRKQALAGLALSTFRQQEGHSREELESMVGSMIALEVGQFPTRLLEELGQLELLVLALGADDEFAPLAGALSGAADELSGHFADLESGSVVLPVPGGADRDDPAVERALHALDDLDHYLGQAGIDEDGEFLADLMAEFKWLYGDDASREDSAGMLLATLEVALNTALVGMQVLSDEEFPEEAMQGQCQSLEMPLTVYAGAGEPAPDYMEVCVAGDGRVSVVFEGQRGAQQVDMATELDLMLEDNALAMTFVVSGTGPVADGTVENDTASLRVDAGTTFTMEAGDVQALDQLVMLVGQILEGGMPSEEDLAELENLEMDFLASGGGSLVNEMGPEQVRISGGAEDTATGSIHVSVPGFLDGGPLVEVLADGHLEVEGREDSLVDLEGQFHAGVGTGAELETDFDFRFRDMPEMAVSMEGSLSGLGALIDAFMDDPDRFLDGDPVAVVEQYLELGGTAELSIDDPQRHYPEYHFELENTALTVIGSEDHGREALTFFVTSPFGGYLFAGGELVGMVRLQLALDGLDTSGGVDIHVIGETEPRHYSPGALSDVADDDLMDFFEVLMSKLGNS